MRATISVILIAVAVLIFFGYTKGAYDSIHEVQGQIVQYQGALAKAAQLQQLMQGLLAKYNAYNPADLARLQTMLPDQVNNIGLILDLDTLAHQSGLQLASVQIGDVAASGANPGSSQKQTVGSGSTSVGSGHPYDSLDVSFSMHATYSQFIQYISSLQGSLRIVDIVGLTVASGAASGSQVLQQDTSTPASLAQPIGSTSGSSGPAYTFSVTLRTYWLK